MGEIADALIDRMIDGMFAGGHSRHRSRGGFHKGVGKGMWRTAAGVIPMSSMTDEHLQNALALCKKNGNTGKADDIRAELKKREKGPAR